MSDVQRVTVQIRAPEGDDPGQVSTGYFTVADGTVTMTDGEGVPVRGASGELFQRRTEEGPRAQRVLAGILTREVRLALRGESAVEEKFRQRINYQNSSVA